MTWDEKEYQKEWENLLNQEHQVTKRLDQLYKDKRDFHNLEEEVIESMNEVMYHVRQGLEESTSTEDFSRRTDLLDALSQQLRIMDGEFQKSMEEIQSRERHLIDTLDDIIVQKQKTHFLMEEHVRKKGDMNDKS